MKPRARLCPAAPLLVLHLVGLGLLAGCDVVSADGWLYRPFQGPGYSQEEGLLLELPEDATLVFATTYLPVQPTEDAQQLFDHHMENMYALLDEGPEGMVGYSLGLRLLGSEYRTLTVWTSYEAMYDFVLNEAHLAAVEDAPRIGGEGGGKVTQWEGTTHDLPPRWEDARARLDTGGRVAY